MSTFTFEKLVEIFAPASAPVEQLAADTPSQTFVAFTFDKAQEYAAKPFLTPLLFLFRGRSDLVRTALHLCVCLRVCGWLT